MRNLGKPVELAGQYYLDGADEVLTYILSFSCIGMEWNDQFHSIPVSIIPDSIPSTHCRLVFWISLVFVISLWAICQCYRYTPSLFHIFDFGLNYSFSPCGLHVSTCLVLVLESWHHWSSWWANPSVLVLPPILPLSSCIMTIMPLFLSFLLFWHFC